MGYCKDCVLWERGSPWVGKCSEWAATKEGPPFIIASKTCSDYNMGENIVTMEQFGCPAWQERQRPFVAHDGVLGYHPTDTPTVFHDIFFADIPEEILQAICDWLNALWLKASDDE